MARARRRRHAGGVSLTDLSAHRSTYPVTRTRRDTVLGRLWTAVGVAVPAVGRWVAATAPRARQVVLYASGLGLVTAAAFTITTTIGLAAAGVSCLLFEWLSTPDDRNRR